MSALGMASLGTQCVDKALGQASLGVFCLLVIIEEVDEGGSGTGKIRSQKVSLGTDPKSILRDDEEVLMIITMAVQSGILDE